MYQHILTAIISILISFHVSEANQSPVVSNVRAQQRPGTKFVDITYDVIDNDNNPLNIELQLSSDGGQTFSVPAVTFSEDSDVGTGITPGTGKRIVWDAGKDVPNAYGVNYVAKIIANDGSVANIIYYTRNSNNETEIYELTPDGESLPTKLFTFPYIFLQLSLDRTKIAFIQNILKVKYLNSPIITDINNSTTPLLSTLFWSNTNNQIYSIHQTNGRILLWDINSRTSSVIATISETISQIPEILDVSKSSSLILLKINNYPYIIDVEKNIQTRIDIGRNFYQARFSPDNLSIVIASYSSSPLGSGISLIQLSPLSSGELRKNAQTYFTHADFSPDGTQVVFVESGIIYKINIDKTGLTPLINTVDNNIYYLKWK